MKRNVYRLFFELAKYAASSRQGPVRLAIVIDEYGSLEGIVTQTDLLEAIAGDLPDMESDEPDIVEREDGSLLIDGTMPAYDAFARLGFRSGSVVVISTRSPGSPCFSLDTFRKLASILTIGTGDSRSSTWMEIGLTSCLRIGCP